MSAGCRLRMQLFVDAGNGWPHSVVRCGIISSCQSAASSETVKALPGTSLTHVRSAIAITGPLPLTITENQMTLQGRDLFFISAGA